MTKLYTQADNMFCDKFKHARWNRLQSIGRLILFPFFWTTLYIYHSMKPWRSSKRWPTMYHRPVTGSKHPKGNPPCSHVAYRHLHRLKRWYLLEHPTNNNHCTWQCNNTTGMIVKRHEISTQARISLFYPNTTFGCWPIMWILDLLL